MTIDQLLNHLRPESVARLIAEMVRDHADELDDGEFNFRTEDAKDTYAQLLAAGINQAGDDEFFSMIDAAVDHELAGE